MNPSRRGYILLTTLLLIALAGAAMVGVSRRSLARALDASHAEDELQRRWGVLTTRATLLNKAALILQIAEKREKRFVSFTQFSLCLGWQDFHFTVQDEQAKLNVNEFFRRKGTFDTERALRQLLPGDAPPETLLLRPLPDRIDPATKQMFPAFQSFGQLFASDTPPSLVFGDADRAGLARSLTLWSDGRLNYRRASPEVMQVLGTPTLNSAQIQDLISFRDDTGAVALSTILPRLQLTGVQRARVETLFVDGSSSHSLWIVVQTPRRRWYHLAVALPGPESKSAYFEW